MNRIRKYNDVYQVLITPTQPFNPSFEIMMGGWTDEHLRNYSILEFTTMADAHCKAMDYPDINWTEMVLNYKNSYHDLKDVIKNVLEQEHFIADLDSNFMTQQEAKEAMFNRVMNEGKRFTLVYHMNDIIQYHISNPWTKNCLEIAAKLIKNEKLRLFRKITSNGAITLVGKTDLGLTYEITVWPTIILNWAKWCYLNKNVDSSVKKSTFIKATKLQNEIDNTMVIR